VEDHAADGPEHGEGSDRDDGDQDQGEGICIVPSGTIHLGGIPREEGQDRREEGREPTDQYMAGTLAPNKFTTKRTDKTNPILLGKMIQTCGWWWWLQEEEGWVLPCCYGSSCR
jgi:hypothetical protein